MGCISTARKNIGIKHFKRKVNFHIIDQIKVLRYRSEPSIPIFSRRVTWNYAYRPFFRNYFLWILDRTEPSLAIWNWIFSLITGIPYIKACYHAGLYSWDDLLLNHLVFFQGFSAHYVRQNYDMGRGGSVPTQHFYLSFCLLTNSATVL